VTDEEGNAWLDLAEAQLEEIYLRLDGGAFTLVLEEGLGGPVVNLRDEHGVKGRLLATLPNPHAMPPGEVLQ